jgi:WD40 repeat protein
MVKNTPSATLQKKPHSNGLSAQEPDPIFAEPLNNHANREIAENSKKIKKPSKPITSVKIKEKFESFYSGGEIRYVPEEELLIALYEGKVRLYSLKTHCTIFEIEHKEEDICNFEYCVKNDTKHLFTFTKNGILRQLKLIPSEEKKFEIETVQKKKFLKFLAIEMKMDKSGKFLIIADPRGEFKLLNIQSFKLLREFSLGTGYTKMRVVGQYIIFVSRDRSVTFYNILTNNKTRVLKAENETAFSDFAVLGSSNKSIVLSGFDDNLYMFNETKNRIVPVLQLNGFVNILETLRISNEENLTLVILGYDNGSVEFAIYNGNTDTFVKSACPIFESNKHRMEKILFDYKKSEIFFITEEGEVFRTKIKKQAATPNGAGGKKSTSLPGVSLELLEEFVGLNDEVMDVKFINHNFAVVCSNSETIRVINIKNRSGKLLNGHDDLSTTVDIYKEKYMITGAKDGKIFLWKINQEKTEESDPIHDGQLPRKPKLSFNVEDEEPGQLISGLDEEEIDVSDDQEPEEYGLNKIGFKLMKKYKAHTGSISSLRFGKKTGSKFVSAGTEGIIKLWDLKQKTCKSIKPHAKELNFVRISPNEKIVMTGSHDRNIHLYNANDLTLITKINAHKRGVWDAEFAPIEKLIASGSSDSLVKIWNYENPEEVSLLVTLQGHTSAVLKICWLLKGLQVASASADGVIKIWNIRKAVCMATYEHHEGRVWAMDVLEVGVDKAQILSGDNANGLMLWQDNSDEIVAEKNTEIQENRTFLDNVDILCNNGDFEGAIKFCFHKKMFAALFEAISKLRKSVLKSTDVIYDIELLESETKDEAATIQAFEQRLQSIIIELLHINKIRLLTALKNFVTHSKYSAMVQTILKLVLSYLKLSKMAELSEEMKAIDADVKQIYDIYKIFTQKYLSSLQRNLKVVNSFNITLSQHSF